MRRASTCFRIRLACAGCERPRVSVYAIQYAGGPHRLKQLHVLEGHEHAVRGVALLSTDDASLRFASASKDGVVSAWQARHVYWPMLGARRRMRIRAGLVGCEDGVRSGSAPALALL